MKDILDELAATERGVTRRLDDGTEVVAVSLRRRYPAEPADVWDAVVDPERLRRWFLPSRLEPCMPPATSPAANSPGTRAASVSGSTSTPPMT